MNFYKEINAQQPAKTPVLFSFFIVELFNFQCCPAMSYAYTVT